MICGQTSSLFERASALGQVFTDRTTRLPCFELSDHAAQMKLSPEVLAQHETAALSLLQVLAHPPLYTAYPWLADIQVNIDARLDAMDAATDSQSCIYASPATSVPVLLHEIQHLVETVEGYATGTSAEAIGAQILQLRPDNEMQKHAKAMFEIMMQTGAIRGLNEACVRESVNHQFDYAAEQGLSKSEIKDAFDNAMQMNKAAYRSYYLCPGELMAFESQSRAPLTPEQRQMFPPLSALGSPYVLPRPFMMATPAGGPTPRASSARALDPSDLCSPEQALPALREKAAEVYCPVNALPYKPDFCAHLRIVHNPAVAHAQQKLTF